jgi:Fe-S cluster assembly protein SufD
MTTEATAAPPKTKSQVLHSFDVNDFPKLNGLEEEWRFTPLKRLGEPVRRRRSSTPRCRPA